MAGISVKELFEALAKLTTSSPRSRHWISPHWELKAASVEASPGNSTSTHIQICNLNAEPVKVTIKFFNSDGSLQSQLNATKVDNLPPFGHVSFGPAAPGTGLVELIATAPIYPSGYITTDAAPPTFNPNPDAQMETVAFAMTFYALPDE